MAGHPNSFLQRQRTFFLTPALYFDGRGLSRLQAFGSEDKPGIEDSRKQHFIIIPFTLSRFSIYTPVSGQNSREMCKRGAFLPLSSQDFR
ncbi:hypothetical protein AVEN_163468-1 [Araneus ventricosus]|uniref:Uncharacterized protein n=1 Tax=Araneus ventricosus TaxID=182803 RepID=A0A4Y2JUT9_ARAVE|nr:hypothetical protein AVEN_163468-1 [Araneus ventricosus]